MSTCMFVPVPLSLTGQTPGVESITIVTTLGSRGAPAPRRLPPFAWTYVGSLVALILFAFAISCFCRRRRKTVWAVSAFLLLVALATLGGCVSNSTPSNAGGTPPGTYAVSFAAQGAVTANSPSTLTLTVIAP
jgi:hypothetical protein